MTPTQTAGTLTNTTPTDKYRAYVNPEWVRLIETLGIEREFVTAYGAELTDSAGSVFMDCLAGYGVYNIGHHHPHVTAELINEMRSMRPNMLQSEIPSLAAELARRLCELAGGKAEKVYFTNSGSEGVETAIKFSRSFTKRDCILAAAGGFHGLTCGALSLMDNAWWKEGFGPLLNDVSFVSFGDLAQLEKELQTRKYAAFILEPIQGESGIVLPPESYLKAAQGLCERYGTMLVLDEVQTGLHRTGPFLASQLYSVQPDMTILAKALSGGQIPVGAVLMRSDICHSVYSSIAKSFVHASTFGENNLAMRAGLATLDVMARERLGEKSIENGQALRAKLNAALSQFDFVKEVRGAGMFNAVEFRAPKSLGLKLLFNGFMKAHPGLFGQMVVKSLFEDHKLLCQMAGNNYLTIKLIPPITLSSAEIDRIVSAMVGVCESIGKEMTRFWSQGLKIAAKSLL